MKVKEINQKMEENKMESKDMKVESKDERNQKIEIPKDEKSKDIGLKIGQKMKLNQDMMEFLDGTTFDSTEQGMKKFYTIYFSYS